MSTATAALHSPAELALIGCDDITGIVEFATSSKHDAARVNVVSLDTATGETICDCRGAECGRDCWHSDHVSAAWLASDAMLAVRWLTDDQLFRYDRKARRMVDTYTPRARVGRSPTIPWSWWPRGASGGGALPPPAPPSSRWTYPSRPDLLFVPSPPLVHTVSPTHAKEATPMATMTVGECPCGEVGTLVDGRCAWCEAAARRVTVRLTPRPRPINDLLLALLAELGDEDVPDPLAQPLTLGAVWLDFCRLSGEESPAILAALTADAPAPAAPAPVSRGSFANHRLQFPESYRGVR